MSRSRHFLRNAIRSTSLGIALTIAAGTAFAAETGSYDQTLRTKVKAASSITLLPRDVSKSLKISRVPTSKPIPLIVGTIFTCETNDLGFEICDTLVVVCNNDQTFCTQIP